MGYDVHISKVKPWTKSKSNPITGIEWGTIVSRDTEIHFVNEAETSSDSNQLLYRNNEISVLNYKGIDGKTKSTYLDFRDGRIVVKHPDEKVIEKMKEIANS